MNHLIIKQILIFGLLTVSTTSWAFDGGPLRVQIDSLTKMNTSNRAKVLHAAEVLEQVVNSDAFQQRVLNFHHEVTGVQEYQDNLGLSNLEVLRKIQSGAETLKPDVDHTMNFTLSGYIKWNPFSSTIGETTPDVSEIGMADSFIRNATTSDIVGNMMHEWTHKAGFDHSFEYDENRNSSVPYAVGNIACELAAEETQEPCF